MFRATVGPVTAVMVETRYGPLEFQLRAVQVRDAAGGLVGEFTCEDDPADFDAEASKHGWVRVGMDGPVVLVDRVGAQLPVIAPAAPVVPEPTVTELAGSAVWSLVKLGVVGVVLVCFVAACVRFVF